MSATDGQTHTSGKSSGGTVSQTRQASAAVECYLRDDEPWRRSVTAAREKNDGIKEAPKDSEDTESTFKEMTTHMKEHQKKHNLRDTWR